MKKITLFSLILLLSVQVFAQKLTPIKWQIKPSKDEVKMGEVIDLRFEATIEHDWYLYSNDFSPDLGPKLTVIDIKPNETIELVGKPTAIGQKKKYDDIWGGEYTYFKEKGLFIQKVKVLKNNAHIEGLIDYQVCTDKDGRCIPLKEKISVANIKVISTGVVDQTPTKPTVVPAIVPVATPTAPQPAEKKTENVAQVPLKSGSIPPKVEKSPALTQKEVVSTTADITKSAQPESDTIASQTIVEEPTSPSNLISTDVSSAVTNQTGSTPIEQLPLWRFLALAFSLGFASIFMPCIYPIMPMTISMFTKQENGKPKAIFYGLSIMFIFGLTGFVAMGLGAPFLNLLATHWVPNLIFFLIFVLFGISMLGGFEIMMPSSVVNKIDAAADKKGLVGIFFMALTLVVVSFSCTVPFVGSLLILSSNGEVVRPLLGMLAFGLPFALVFSGLAFFPNVLKTLPKSGGWLGELKVVFALLEFALAIKFLSNIDLAYHFDSLSRNLFLYIWIFFSVAIALYIFGIIRLPSDAKVKFSPARIGFGAIFTAAAVYLAMGINAKPLSLLEGFLPPLRYGLNKNVANDGKLRDMEHGLKGFIDYDDAIAEAKATGKPVLIDFTGFACANCRKMEENIWPNPEVNSRMKNDFVLASLYVDDKKELPKEKQYISKTDELPIVTIGDKNLDIEITKFNNNAQPLYCLVDGNGKLLTEPFSYTKKPEVFIEFLKKAGKK